MFSFQIPPFFIPESYFVSIICLSLNKFGLCRLSPKCGTSHMDDCSRSLQHSLELWKDLGAGLFFFWGKHLVLVEVFDPMSAVPWRQGCCMGVMGSGAGGCHRFALTWGLWILTAPLPDCLLLFWRLHFLGCLSVLLISITSFILSIASHDPLEKCPQISSWYFLPAFFSFSPS